MPSHGQTQISGKVTDFIHDHPAANAMVLLYNDNNNKILEYKLSDAEGEYSFSKKYNEGIYRLEVSKIGYNKNEQKIVVGTDEDKSLVVEVALLPKDEELDELVINTDRAIVVKQDTIIYNIDHFTEYHDESLEQVLTKISGFKISPNGEIQVNGKVINKVLIDNKEVSDFGAAILTKTLSPEKVKSVEVRFDEKNEKLKESLLSNQKFVVLDIQLQPDVKKSFFGKQQISLGFQDNIKVGGLTNLFSLNDKYNIQFFAENNNFGSNHIKLNQIRNIGAEASARIFSIPVDFDDIKQRRGYHDEIYGFENFTDNDNTIIGFSANVPLSNKTDLYVGSFTNYQFIQNQYSRQLYQDRTLIDNNVTSNYINEYDSKNKIQLKHTSKSFKLSSDLNYVHFDQKLNNDITQNEHNHIFNKKHFSNNFYFNNFLEYKISNQLGIVSGFSYSDETFNIISNLKRSDDALTFFWDTNDKIGQRNINRQKVTNAYGKLTYKSNIGTHSVGYKLHGNVLDNKKESESFLFSANLRQYKSTSHAITYNSTFLWSKLFLDWNIEYAFIDFPSLKENQFTQKKEGYFQYRLNAIYDFDMFTNIHLSTSHFVAPFPLQKVTLGNVLMDYQTILLNNPTISPYYNTNYSLTFSKVYSQKSELLIALLNGISRNLNNQSFKNEIVFLNAEQLKSTYFLASTTYKLKLQSIPLILTFEPEFMLNTSEFIINENIQHTKASRFLGGVKLNFQVLDNISIYYYPKYSHFIFENSISNHSTNFSFLSNYININVDFLESKFLAQIDYKRVDFIRNKSSFNNFTASLTYKTDQFRYFLSLHNVLNTKDFITQDLDMTLLNINNNHVFGRYINFGFEFKIN